MSDWRDCIVILIDLIGVKRQALKGDSRASSLMRRFHQVVCQEMRGGLTSLDHAYVWNDAVLLLAYLDEHVLQGSLHDAALLKRKIDGVKRSYAIAVMGQAFPSDSPCTSIKRGNNGDHDARVIVMKASSYAMSNCFEIEAEVKARKLHKAWYVDERIIKKLGIPAEESITIKLLPEGIGRNIHMYPGDLQSPKTGKSCSSPSIAIRKRRKRSSRVWRM
jgi:hypothetical protein